MSGSSSVLSGQLTQKATPGDTNHARSTGAAHTSDPGATTATKDGEEWVLEGHKWFITNASVADIVLVFAETNPEARPHRHASIFVVPRGTPGMEIVRDIETVAHPEPEYDRLGNHAEIIFRNCRIPADHLIGQPGEVDPFRFQ